MERQKKLQKLIKRYSTEPETPIKEIAHELGISAPTAYKKIAEFAPLLGLSRRKKGRKPKL